MERIQEQSGMMDLYEESLEALAQLTETYRGEASSSFQGEVQRKPAPSSSQVQVGTRALLPPRNVAFPRLLELPLASSRATPRSTVAKLEMMPEIQLDPAGEFE